MDIQFVAPRIAGQVVTPFSSGVLPGTSCGRPSGPMPLAQVSFCTNGRASKHFPIHAIEHVEEPVAIRLQHELSRPALEHRVDEDGRLLRVPVPQIMRGELIMPAQLSRPGLEREERIGVQVVALPLAAVSVRVGIAGRPEQRIGLGVVGSGQPRRTASFFEIDVALPRFGAGLTSRGNGPEAPRLLAGRDAIGREKSANAFVAARHAGDDEIADHERRHRAAVGLLGVFRQHDLPEQRAIHPAHRDEMRVICDEKDP